MSLLKASIFNNYIYSPKSWLHKQNIFLKLIFIVVSLVSASYMSSLYLFVTIFLYLLIYKSLKVPSNIESYLLKIFIFFNCILITNMQSQEQVFKESYFNRKYVIIFYSLQHYVQIIKNQDQVDLLNSSSYYVPLSIIRLLSLNFLYLIVMRTLLLTTTYFKILSLLIYHCPFNKKLFIQKLIFETQVAVNFLSIILKQIQDYRIASLTRAIMRSNRKGTLSNVFIYFCSIQQLFMNILKYTYDISNTMLDYEICNNNLSIIYKRWP